MMPPVLMPISHIRPVSILARCPLQCMIIKCLYLQTDWQYTADSACSAGVPGPLQANLPKHVSLGYSLTCPCYACCDRMPHLDLVVISYMDTLVSPSLSQQHSIGAALRGGGKRIKRSQPDLSRSCQPCLVLQAVQKASSPPTYSHCIAHLVGQPGKAAGEA